MIFVQSDKDENLKQTDIQFIKQIIQGKLEHDS